MTGARHRILILCLVVFALLVAVVPAFAQTPVPPPTAAELITDSTGLLTDLGVMPIIFVGAIIGAGVYLLRRVKSGAR